MDFPSNHEREEGCMRFLFEHRQRGPVDALWHLLQG